MKNAQDMQSHLIEAIYSQGDEEAAIYGTYRRVDVNGEFYMSVYKYMNFLGYNAKRFAAAGNRSALKSGSVASLAARARSISA